MKNLLLLNLLIVFTINYSMAQETNRSVGMSSQSEFYDYNINLYLAIGTIDFGNMCGYDAPNYQPGDVFQYGTHTWIDLNKLYTIAYRQNTFFNGNQHFWTTFGGFGHPTIPGSGWEDGKIDRVKRNFVQTSTFGAGVLKFANVKVPGTMSNWGTAIWINVFSQCHNQCNQGTWWKFERNLTADQARHFANTHKNPNATDSFVNGTNVRLTFRGNPACNPTAVYGFGPGQIPGV